MPDKFRIEGFDFQAPVTFYGVADESGFLAFLGNYGPMWTVKKEMSDGTRASIPEENVNMFQITIKKL